MSYLLQAEDFNRVNFHWITGRIACGGHMAGPADAAQLKELGVTHVVNCMAEEALAVEKEWSEAAGLSYIRPEPLQMDDGHMKPPEWFSQGGTFVRDALMNTEGRVFVHCGGGINRAPSMVYFILRLMNTEADEAAALIKAKRPQAAIGYRHDADAALETLRG